MRSLVPPRGNSARTRRRDRASPRAGVVPRVRLLPRARLLPAAGGPSRAGVAARAVARIGSSIVPRLVLSRQNLLDDRLVSVLALQHILTGRQVGSEHLARGGTRTMAQNTSAEAAAVPTGPRREVLIILPGLLLAIMLAMLDQLVVSTALPRIVGDLGGVAHLSWVVTAYVLAATITTPLYGKL